MAMSLKKWVTPPFPIKIHEEYGTETTKNYPNQFHKKKDDQNSIQIHFDPRLYQVRSGTIKFHLPSCINRAKSVRDLTELGR